MSDLLFIAASPYQKDVLNLPVKDLDTAIPFYEDFMGFQILERAEVPYKRATLWRQDVKIGLAENGGNPEEEGSYFKVSSVQVAFDFFSTNGLKECEKASLSERINDEGMFFIVAPDQLCYCFGEE